MCARAQRFDFDAVQFDAEAAFRTQYRQGRDDISPVVEDRGAERIDGGQLVAAHDRDTAAAHIRQQIFHLAAIVIGHFFAQLLLRQMAGQVGRKHQSGSRIEKAEHRSHASVVVT